MLTREADAFGGSCVAAPLRLLAVLLLAILSCSSACSSLPAGVEKRLAVFDAYTQELGENYPFFAQKQIDWPALTRAYRSAIWMSERPSDFYHLLAGMLAELNDPHVSLSVPDECWSQGDADFTSLYWLRGFRTFWVERSLHVESWPAGCAPTPPEHLPVELASFPEITHVEGARTVVSMVDLVMRGEPGSEAELLLRWADGTRTRHTLVRPPKEEAETIVVEIEGKDVVVDLTKLDGRSLDSALSLGQGRQLGWFRFDTFSPAKCNADADAFSARADQLLDELREEGELPLVLDLRRNGGGKLAQMASFVGRFLTERVELVQGLQEASYLFGLIQLRLFQALSLDPRGVRWDRPIYVLTSWRTASAAEILARILQRDCGATLLGEQTIGAEALLASLDGDDGSTLTYGRTRQLDGRGVGIQDEGVTPDIAVRLRLEDVRRLGSYDAAKRDWQRRLERAIRRHQARH
ncbi:MAG: S41 family peptidase [Planctomycetota bacterium]